MDVDPLPSYEARPNVDDNRTHALRSLADYTKSVLRSLI
jgi:hypothetical protein